MLSVLRNGALRSVSRGHKSFKVLSVYPLRDQSALAASEEKQVPVEQQEWYLKDKEYWGDYVPPQYVPPKQYSMEERIEIWNYCNSVFFGPERDMKNFPNVSAFEKPMPVRLGVIPAAWFDFYKEKMGVSGGYVFLFGLWLTTTSKEINPIDHYYWELPSFACAMYILHKHPKIGPNIKKMFQEVEEKRVNQIHNRPIAQMRSSAEKGITKLERMLEETEVYKYFNQTKEEGVLLQLEAAYRQRLQTVYQEVKNRLDYEAEKSNVKKQFEQEHMVNWIVSNVRSSITPQQEKESIKSCIQALKDLSVKQPGIV